MPRGPTDDQLLDAAAAEITERGLNGTTVQAVADRAGSTKMTLRARFADKQGLLDAAVGRAARAWAATAEQAAAGNPDAPAAAVHTATARLLGAPHHPHVVLLALLEAPDGTDACRHALDCTHRLTAALTAAGGDPQALLSLLVGATAIAISGENTSPLTTAADRAAGMSRS